MDSNQNGKAEPKELLTLQEAGIKSINVNYAADKWVDANGNQFRYTSTATFSNGRTEAVYDVYLMTANRNNGQAKK